MRRLDLSTRVLLGLLLGVVAGLFFGELTRPLEVVGRAFILMLQIAVLPFMVVSLVYGLGHLDRANALALARGGGIAILLLWALVMAVVLVFPLSFPDWASASFFSRTLTEASEPVDLLGLYIPSNPFASLAGGVVPAIVVFSVALGLALIAVEEKSALLSTLASIRGALERITGAVVGLAPYGVFALMASAAGTLDLAELGKIQVYLLVYVGVSLALVFWILPSLVATLTPIRYRELIGPVRDALTTAFATGNLLVVLPILAREGKAILQRSGIDEATADNAIDVLIPASFTLPNMGKLLSLAFVPFAGWFTGFAMSADQYPLFALAGLVSFFGEPVVSLPFLLDLLRIPSDTFQLFVTVDVIASRFGTLLGATHTLVLAVLAAYLMSGRVQLSGVAALRFGLVSAAVLALAIGGARLFFTYGMEPSYTGYKRFVELQPVHEAVATRIHETLPPMETGSAGRRLARIRERGTLRVGYFSDALPYAFRNASGKVVGFDIEMAGLLARSMGVTLELVRIPRGQAPQALQRGSCDIIMSGTVMTPDETSWTHFSEPLGDLTLAFAVPDHERGHFGSWKAIRARKQVAIALARSRYFEPLLKSMIPGARIVTIDSPREYFADTERKADALVISAENGSAWTLVYPEFSIAVPQPGSITVPRAYMMPLGEHRLAEYVDVFIQLKKRDGTADALFEHWFEGRGGSDRKPRWSVVRDVLGWGEE